MLRLPADIDTITDSADPPHYVFAAHGECACDTEDVLADLYQPTTPAADDDERHVAAYYKRRPLVREDERAWEHGADLGGEA